MDTQAEKEDAADEVGIVETALCAVVSECSFSVAAADPCSLDSDLVAVSEGFLRMTGYEREEVIGENCRFLSEGCPMASQQRARLKLAAETGAPFTGVVVNRKKSGGVFLNLIDLRGLVLARNAESGEDLWVALGVQMDVSDMDRDRLPENHLSVLNQVASRVRKRLMKTLAELGLGGSLDGCQLHNGAGGERRNATSPGPGSWRVLMETQWRPGDPCADGVKQSMKELPEDIMQLSHRLPKLVALSNRVKPLEEAMRSLSAPGPAPGPAELASPSDAAAGAVVCEEHRSRVGAAAERQGVGADAADAVSCSSAWAASGAAAAAPSLAATSWSRRRRRLLAGGTAAAGGAAMLGALLLTLRLVQARRRR